MAAPVASSGPSRIALAALSLALLAAGLCGCAKATADTPAHDPAMAHATVASQSGLCMAVALGAGAKFQYASNYEGYAALKDAEGTCLKAAAKIGEVGATAGLPLIRAEAASCGAYARDLAHELSLKAAVANGDLSPRAVYEARAAVTASFDALSVCNADGKSAEASPALAAYRRSAGLAAKGL